MKKAKIYKPSKSSMQSGTKKYNKWVFKTENNEEKIEIEEKTIPEPIIEDNKNLTEDIEKDLLDEDSDNREELNYSDEKFEKKVNKKYDINYFKILIVIIISFVALILVLDTFQTQLSIIMPNIEFILDNLYQSINDTKLFILDLIK